MLANRPVIVTQSDLSTSTTLQLQGSPYSKSEGRERLCREASLSTAGLAILRTNLYGLNEYMDDYLIDAPATVGKIILSKIAL